MKPWVVIYAIGAAQAVLLALALMRQPANRMLAVWLALIALDLAVKALYLVDFAPGLFKAYRFVALFPFLYGFLFYLYVRALTTGRGFGGRDLVHLAGFALALALTFRVFLLDPAQTAASSARLAAGDWSPPVGWYDKLLFGYSLSYVVAALVRLQHYRQRLRQRRSDADRRSLRWIWAMAIAQLVVWCIAATHWLVRTPGVDYFLIYGAVAAWVCMVGWFSLGQPPVADDDDPSQADAEPAQDAAPVPEDDPRFPEVEARLSQLMTNEALYREPALTIGQLAKRSGYPEYLVSAVINRRFGDNFWEYINRQRVEAARACLAEPGDTRTILEIAYASGFTSKSTFNAAFKRQAGQTPSSYRQQHAAGARTRSASR